MWTNEQAMSAIGMHDAGKTTCAFQARPFDAAQYCFAEVLIPSQGQLWLACCLTQSATDLLIWGCRSPFLIHFQIYATQ